jgi:hypothetical protein
MTDEDINRKFDVVADHLATLAVNQQKAEERAAKADARAAKADTRLDRLERVLMLAIRANQRERKETREGINALVAAQTHTEEALTRLADSQTHTDKRLDALIDIVQERNGSS